MPRDPLAHFVDRERELGLFRAMLSDSADKRILLILDEGEQGKSCLLRRLLGECEAHGRPAVLLDFDRRRSGLGDWRDVAGAVRRGLGDERTPHLCACEADLFRPRPLVHVQTGSGEGGVDFGRRGQFGQAAISDVAGRDRVSIGDVSGSVPPVDPRLARDATGRALVKDLAALPNAVLLVDTFEGADQEACTWLESWLLEPLRRQLPRVLLVIAGRPACRPFFERPVLWGSLVTALYRLDALSDEDILAHYQKRGLPVSRDEESLLRIARANPARMAQIGDWLEQGGGR